MILIAMFTINAGFSGTRLGLCWVMLEERWAFLAYLANLPICLFSLFAYLSLGLFAYLPVCLFAFLNICLFDYLPFGLFGL